MEGVNKSSSLFHRKVRNQVLENNRKIDYFPKCHIFEKMKHTNYTPLNDFRTTLLNKGAIMSLDFYGPKDYSWKDEAKCYFFDLASYKFIKNILAIPHNWLHHYDPTIPIFNEGWYSAYYLDLEEHRWTFSTPYLIRDKFYRDDFKHSFYSSSKGPMLYSIRKGDEDWCITHLKLYPSYMINSNFWSFLLIKNIDFSEFDAKVKAEGLKCPAVPYKGIIKIKDNPKIRILYWSCYIGKKRPCFCVICRKDYRAFKVRVEQFNNYFNLHILFLLYKK